MTESEAVSKQLNYSKTERMNPSYRITKLTPREGSSAVEITTSGGQQTHFDIPEYGWNPAKTVLSFTFTPRAGGGGGRYNYTFMDCLSTIRQIQLYTRSGTYLCDWQELGNTTKMIWKPETDMKKFLALENHDNGVGAGCMLQKCNAGTDFKAVSDATRLAALTTALTASTTTVTAHTPVATAGNNTYTDATTNAALTDVEAKVQAAIRAGVDASKATVQAALKAWMGQPSTNARRHDDALIADDSGASSLVNVPYQEAKYFAVGGSNTATPVISVKMPLSMLYDSIFEHDKTILFNEILSLRIVWAPSTKIHYYGTDAKCPSEGTVQAAVSVDVANPTLFLATETSQEVINALRAKIASGGMSFLTPYPHVYKTALAGGSQNVILRFDRGHGRKLKKIYHSVFNNAENKNTAYDHDNRADAKITEFYTTLDSKRVQDFNVDTSALEDYMLLKPKLDGSALMNSNVYQYNWFWVDDFTGDAPLWKKDHNVSEGLSLAQERRWEFVSTTAGANLSHYTFAVLEKEVKITPQGITCD
jgi:hypothetical protein